MSNGLAELPYVRDVKPLDETDQPFLQALVALMEKHNVIDRFGLTLLHDHFPMSEDEVMLEKTNAAARFQTLQVVDRASVPDGTTVLETAWRLHRSGAVVMSICTKVCYESGGVHDDYHLEVDNPQG